MRMLATEANLVDTNGVLVGVREWAEIETPSGDASLVNQLVSVVQRRMAMMGLVTERIPEARGLATS